MLTQNFVRGFFLDPELLYQPLYIDDEITKLTHLKIFYSYSMR